MSELNLRVSLNPNYPGLHPRPKISDDEVLKDISLHVAEHILEWCKRFADFDTDPNWISQHILKVLKLICDAPAHRGLTLVPSTEFDGYLLALKLQAHFPHFFVPNAELVRLLDQTKDIAQNYIVQLVMNWCASEKLKPHLKIGDVAVFDPFPGVIFKPTAKGYIYEIKQRMGLYAIGSCRKCKDFVLVPFEKTVSFEQGVEIVQATFAGTRPFPTPRTERSADQVL